ncbi:DUF3597 domain-containing protein [Croceicoccus naphthovorans]|uniref:Uncharacterized protein n=1 Tax=Croceicoccus naphthovorans TaxID=1348774 RepID=A0A0G3XI20_9SPHN|nr:DUF3597 domain-containing protein [Croceicoccus naphthovorans]AKM10847.1 hypothetical protein AB433_14145 [Croceicoccus naphthovorans]MBB3989069.1 hypothetical protein [Croceicoccus naphthovorans]
MGIFSSIRDKIFGKKKQHDVEIKVDGQTVGRDGHVKPTPPGGMPSPTATTTNAGVMDDVDVEARLAEMDGADRLNWRTSIVDLMKLVGIDSSYENRKELATELGDNDYSGKAEENIALHRRVMQALANNGGKVPASMLD